MKKLFAITACVTSAALLFCACTNGGKEAAKSGKPTLRGLVNNVKIDLNTYPVAQMLEEKTGYKVEYDLLPQENVQEKLSLVLASGEDYDFITLLPKYYNLYVDYAQQGALTPLDELIDKDGKNMKKAFSERTFNNMKVDGKIYSVVTADIPVGSKPSTTEMLLVRQDEMDTLGIKSPKTLDEFTAMLKTIKEKDPGNNKSQNVPLTLAGTTDVPGVYGAFGIANVWNDVNGKLVHRAEDPRYKEYLSYLHDLYTQGLLDPEFPTNKTATIQEKFTSGKAAIIPCYYWSVGTVTDSLNKNIPNATLGWLDPPKGKNGDCGFGVGGGNGINRLTVIPKTSNKAEDVIKWMDSKLDEDTFRDMVIGEEGKHYTVKDGEYWPILPTFFDERSYANEFLTGIDESVYANYWKARVRKDERVYNAFKYMCLDERILDFGVQNPVEDVPIMEGQKNEAVLNQLLQDYSVKVVTGAEPISDYDKFLSKWKSAGGEQWSNEMNEWYTNKNK